MTREIKIQLGEDDHIAANLLHSSYTRDARLIGGAAWLILALAGYFLYMNPALSDPIQGLGLALIVIPAYLLVFFAVLRLLVPRAARKLFRQTKTAGDPYVVTWDDSNITVTAANWMQNATWSDFFKWRENDKLLLLYINNRSFRIIPKRAFPDAATLNDFARLVHEKVGVKPPGETTQK